MVSFKNILEDYPNTDFHCAFYNLRKCVMRSGQTFSIGDILIFNYSVFYQTNKY
jgi:hypothetical protein